MRVFYFFFSSRRRHTRYIGDWSSDVCSSDLVTLCLLVFVTAQAVARSKLSPELQHAKPGKPVDVIVQFTSDPSEQLIGKVTGKGAALKQKLSMIHGAAYTSLPVEALAQLAQDPDVAYVTPDRPVQGATT